MDFSLPQQTTQLARELSRWSAKRAERLGDFDGFDLGDWKELVGFGLLGLTQSGGSEVDLAVGVMEVAAAAVPGPVVEAQLAMDSGCVEAIESIAQGRVVTSVGPGNDGPAVVGWGAVADLVVDQASGEVLARGPLPRVQTTYPLPLGWVERPSNGNEEALAARRWLLTAAAVTGLGEGAVRRATQHARDRTQFGRPLASFQAVQFRLAESLNFLEGARLSVLDAAWRAAEGRADADAAAALTWLWAYRAAERAAEHAHQVYGALGFCNEAGLVQLTSQAAWYRRSLGRREAARYVMERRARASGPPPSRVLAGFR